jgi:hypothetical protein
MAKHQRDSGPLTGSSEAGINYIDDDLLPQESDLIFEAELLRNPNLPSLWSRYLDARKDATARRRYVIFERAVNALPGSYKVCIPFIVFVCAVVGMTSAPRRGAATHFVEAPVHRIQTELFFPHQPSINSLPSLSFTSSSTTVMACIPSRTI